MLVYSRVNAIIPSNDGREKVRVNRGVVAEVPKWALATAYYKALVADGKLVPTSKATADRDAQQAEDKKPDNAGESKPEEPDKPGKPSKDDKK